MQLLLSYEDAIKNQLIIDDPLQREIIVHLQKIIDLIELPWLLRRLRGYKYIKGAYIYGHVGVGKTFLMDLLFKSLPETKKARYHFHHFMQYVDEQLRAIQGHKNPLPYIAKKIAKDAKVLCLDEFFVTNIADAMILGEFLTAIFKEGVTIIATSNVTMNNLYQNGLHRERFLPVIALLKQHCQACALISDRDYRVGKLHFPKAYFTPLNSQTAIDFANEFSRLSGKNLHSPTINIQNRLITVKKRGELAIWFEFNTICAIPRSTLDYLELSELYKVIFVSNIPILTPDDSTAVTLFMHFVDVMYDRKIKIILSAAVPIEGLYTKGPLLQVFQRTLSRLDEMQSFVYV